MGLEPAGLGGDGGTGRPFVVPGGLGKKLRGRLRVGSPAEVRGGWGGEAGARHVRAGGCTCSSARIRGHRDPRARRRATERPSCPRGDGGEGVGGGGDKQPSPLPTCSPRPTRSPHSPLRSGSRAAHGAVREPRRRCCGQSRSPGGGAVVPAAAAALGRTPARPRRFPPPPHLNRTPPPPRPQSVGRRSVLLSALCPSVRSRSGCATAAPRAPRYNAGRGWEGGRPREGVRERNANSSLLGTARRVVPPPLRIPSYQDPPPISVLSSVPHITPSGCTHLVFLARRFVHMDE